MGSDASQILKDDGTRTPLFVTFWDMLPDGRTLSSRTQDTQDAPTLTPNISQWVGAIMDSPSDAGHCNAPEMGVFAPPSPFFKNV